MEKIFEKVNEQFNFELESGYIYLAMSNYLKRLGMDGFAHFMDKQAHEEYEHARKLYNFLVEVDYPVEYKEIPKPEKNYEDIADVFKKAYAHEQEVTRRIRDIYKDAHGELNFEVMGLLDWFIKEQIEEEDNFRGIVEKFERINGNWGGLYIFDHELEQR